MVSLGVVIPIVMFLVMFLFFPIVLMAVIWQRTHGRLMAVMIIKGKPLKFKMLKIVEGEFIKDGTDQWPIMEKYVKIVDYPTMFPGILGFVQRKVPAMLVAPGRTEPLDWENPAQGVMSSKELSAILSPHWLRALVLGTVEVSGGGKTDKNLKVFVLLSMAMAGICMILLFIVLYKFGQVQTVLNIIQKAHQ